MKLSLLCSLYISSFTEEILLKLRAKEFFWSCWWTEEELGVINDNYIAQSMTYGQVMRVGHALRETHMSGIHMDLASTYLQLFPFLVLWILPSSSEILILCKTWLRISGILLQTN